MTKTSDVVVIGAGSAGCVVAARLSEDPTRRVTLLEAGGRDRNPLFRVPLMTGVLLRSRYANWFYHTEPEPGLGGRRSFWPRGRVLGGSSSINGMVWRRGRPSDYDSWAQAGLAGWSWEDALAGFRQIERFQDDVAHTDSGEWHGVDGPLPVTWGGATHPLLDRFIEAGTQAGHAFSCNLNAPPYEGMGRTQFTIAGGQRWSASRAYLDPARIRPNLRIVTGARALRLLMEGRKAIGVATTQGDFHAGEIVLSGGAINSPQLLMLSGIGSAAQLHALGIPEIADLPGVGQNLQDHLLVRVEHACTQPITLQSLTRIDRAAAALVQALVARTGPASTFPLAAGFMLRSNPGLEEPDLQGHFLPGLTTATLRVPGLAGPARAGDGHGFMANVTQMRPHSSGAITLASNDPMQAPVIRPRYLSDPRDRDVIRQGARMLRTIFAQKAFDDVRGPELAPGAAVTSDSDMDAWITRTADTMFHPVGTCRMGRPDDLAAVVDERLRVRGVDCLRVADASIMPRITSGNTNAPSILIGHRCADFMMT